MSEQSKLFKVYESKNAPAAIGAYSPVISIPASAEQFLFSGQIGLDPASMQMREGFKSQLEQILTNIDALLEGANLSRKNIVKTTVFLTDLTNFSMVNSAYETFFSKPYPARSCVEVKALPKGSLVEIEVIAIK
ncbi:MAG: RidA family protein [Oligoflexia bacterium]|nr:RidA family protein [Oligoflexia bacterium]MBF0364630.1 RidA family protein [Oligoflexia bacterium]